MTATSRVEFYSLMQLPNMGTQDAWNAVTLPVPFGLIIYAPDTGVIKIGDGETQYSNLPSQGTLAVILAAALSGGGGGGGNNPTFTDGNLITVTDNGNDNFTISYTGGSNGITINGIGNIQVTEDYAGNFNITEINSLNSISGNNGINVSNDGNGNYNITMNVQFNSINGPGFSNDGNGNYTFAPSGSTSLWNPGVPNLASWLATTNLTSVATGVDVTYELGSAPNGPSAVTDNVVVTISGGTGAAYLFGYINFISSGGTAEIVQTKAFRILNGTHPTMNFDSTPTTGNLIVFVMVGGEGNANSNTMSGFTSDNNHSDADQGVSTGTNTSDGSNSFQFDNAANGDQNVLMVEVANCSGINNGDYEHTAADVTSIAISNIQTNDGSAGQAIFFAEWDSAQSGSFVDDTYTSLIYSTPSDSGTKHAIFGLANLPAPAAGVSQGTGPDWQYFILQFTENGTTPNTINQTAAFRFSAGSPITGVELPEAAADGNTIVVIFMGDLATSSNSMVGFTTFYNNGNMSQGIYVGTYTGDGATNSFTGTANATSDMVVLIAEVANAAGLSMNLYNPVGGEAYSFDYGGIYTLNTAPGATLFGACWYNDYEATIVPSGTNEYNIATTLYNTASGTPGNYYGTFGSYVYAPPLTMIPSPVVNQNGTNAVAIDVGPQPGSPLQWGGWYTPAQDAPYSEVFALSMLGDFPSQGSPTIQGGIFALGWTDGDGNFSYLAFLSNGTYGAFNAVVTSTYTVDIVSAGDIAPISAINIDWSKYAMVLLGNDGTSVSIKLSNNGVSGPTLLSIDLPDLILSSPSNIFFGIGALDGTTAGATWLNLFLLDPNGGSRQPVAPGY